MLEDKNEGYTYTLSIEINNESSESKTMRIYAETKSITDQDKYLKRPLRQMKVAERLHYISLLPSFMLAYNRHVEAYVIDS